MWTADDDAAVRVEHRTAGRRPLDDEEDRGDERPDPEVEIDDAAPEDAGYGHGV